jgi:hypothetical protein
VLLGKINALEIHLLTRFSVRRLGDRSAILRFLNQFQSDPVAMASLSGFLRERDANPTHTPAATRPLTDRLADLIASGDALLGPDQCQLLWRHPVSSQSSFSALAFLQQLRTSPAAMWNLRRFVWKRNLPPDLSSVNDDRILEQVASWVAGREVVVGFRMLLRGGGGETTDELASARPQPAVAAAPAGPQSRKTWIEFVVVDMEGNRVSDLPYRVMLPDGSLHESRLDKTGTVRFNSIDPENCVFSLTDLDQEAWERIS